MLPIPIQDARLLCLHAATAPPLVRLRHQLNPERNCFAAIYDAQHVLVLVRNSPRRAGEDRALTDARRIANLAASCRNEVSVGVSGSIAGDADLPGAFADATHAADLATQSPQRIVY